MLHHRGLFVAGNVPLWSPASLAIPPGLWVNDDSAVSGPSGRVHQWNDLSGNGYHLAGTSDATQDPTVLGSGLAGRRTVQGDGSNDLLRNQGGATGLFQNASQGWLLAVYKRVSGSAANRIVLGATTNTTGIGRFLLCSDSTVAAGRPQIRVRRLDADSVAVLTSPTDLSDGLHHLVLATMDWGARTGRIYIDGSLDSSSTTLTAAAGNTSNTASFEVSAFGLSAAGNAANVEVAEALVGTTLPSAGEIDKLFGYLAHRWGLTARLPAGHPYKIVAPR